MDEELIKWLNYSESGLRQIRENLSKEYIKSAIERAEYTRDRITDILNILHKELKNIRYDKKIITEFDKVETILKKIYEILDFLRKGDSTKFNPQACEASQLLSGLREELFNNTKKLVELFEELNDYKKVSAIFNGAIGGEYRENPMFIKNYFLNLLPNYIFFTERGYGGERDNVKFWQYRYCQQSNSWSTPDWVHGTYPDEENYMKKCLESINVIRRCKQALVEYYAVLNK